MADINRLIRNHIDRAAAKAQRQPSDGQKEAGNYRKGKIRFHGLDISIENPRGSNRSGVGKDGKPWRVALPDHYGYIRRTEGSDGDHVDCYIGRHPLSSRVFVIDQVDADSKEHDEHKCMLGYTSEEQALSAYRRAFSDGRGDHRIGSVKEMDIAQFKNWLERVGGLPKYATGGAVHMAAGGVPGMFDDLVPAAPAADAPAAAAPDHGMFGDLVPTKKPGLPDVGAPLIGNGGQFSGGTDIGNDFADSAAKTANAAIRNAPASAVNFAHDVVTPFIHPVDTMENMKNLGLGVLEKAGVTSGDSHEKYANAVGRFFADRYGGFDKARHTLETDPVGMAGDLSAILTGGETLLARAPGVAGKVGEVAGDIGRTVDPMRAAAPVAETAGNVAGNVASQVLGVTTGVGADPLKVATRAGYEGGPAAQAFRENITGAAPLSDAVDEARAAVAQLRQERGNAYRTQMGPIKADSTILDFNDIDQAVANAQGIKTYSGRSGTGPTQSLSPKTEGIRKEMTDAIDNWKGLDPAEFHTPEGIDALKQQLGDIRDGTEPNTPSRVAADRIYNAVRQTIIDQVPEYAKVMKGYEDASKQIKEIETTLSLKPNVNVDTALRKLQSTLRDNVNTSFGRRAELANFLVSAGAPNLMEKLAGQALHSWVPRGLARLATMETVPAVAGAVGAGATGAGLAAAATLPLMSPRLVGNAAYGAGVAGRYANPVLSRLARPARQIGRVTEPFQPGFNPYAQ